MSTKPKGAQTKQSDIGAEKVMPTKQEQEKKNALNKANRAQKKAYYNANQDAIRAQAKQSYAADSSAAKARSKASYARNPIPKGHSVSIQRKIKSDLFRISSNLVCM